MPISVAPPLPQEIVASLPPVSDIFTTNINVAKSVHHTVRAEVMDLFSALLRGTAVGTETSFKLLFMFPKAILGYKGTSAPSTALIRQRIIAWHAHWYAELWSEAKENRKTVEAQASTKVPTKVPHHAPAGPQTLPANARPSTKRALHLIEEVEYSKALQALLSTGTVPKDQSAATKLQALHPEAPVPAQETEALLRLAETIEISEKQLVSAVRSFSSTTATGVLGIKVPLLKQMLQYDVSGVFTRALRVFVVSCANGKTPEVMRPFLAGASLTGLPKLPSGIRPIAAGEILRRIIAKATLSNAMAQLADFFGDFQLGVGRKGGIEHIVFAINKLVAENVDNPDFVGVKVDMKNAFNTLFRTKMLTAARRFPILAHWLATCYGSHSHLWFGEFVLSSQKGVQQGDPLGPLLFALTLMDTINEIQGLRPLLNKWYLDDGVIFGTHETIAAVIKVLESPSLTGLGLELNASKCELIWLRPEFVRPDAFPSRFSNRITDGNFTIVGSPIGTAEFKDKQIRKVTADAERIWAQLGELHDVQAAYTLFRACATWNRVAHLMRTVHPEAGAAAFRDFDWRLRGAFSNVVSFQLSDNQWTQLTLPTRKGGAGLRSAEHHSPAAFLAASIFFASDTGTAFEDIQGAQVALELLNGRIVNAPIYLDDPSLAGTSQKILSEMVDSLTASKLTMESFARDRARLALVARPGATEWLNVVPATRMGTKMSSAEFLVALKRWVGQPTTAESQQCPQCADHRADEYGDHALQCASGGCK